MTSTLILLRHGESEWNAKNLFTGWVDVDINEKGVGEAKRGAELLKAEKEAAFSTSAPGIHVKEICRRRGLQAAAKWCEVRPRAKRAR